jgi:hypothetical protein
MACCGGVIQVIDEVENNACGDAYLINGQSNALAADLQWNLADALLGNDAGTIGAWGLRAAWLLVERDQIPIAILSGSEGGTPLWQHRRNPNDPEDLDTI